MIPSHISGTDFDLKANDIDYSSIYNVKNYFTETGDQEIKGRKLDDNSSKDSSVESSFDLVELSNKVQDVVNDILEVPVMAKQNTIIKAIENKVNDNYPKFDIGVDIGETNEEGLGVVLNIREMLFLNPISISPQIIRH